MVYYVPSFQSLKKLLFCLICLVALTGATTYNNVSSMMRGYASKYAYYVGGYKDTTISGYTRAEGVIYVWSDWANPNGSYNWTRGKCWKIYIPYSGMVTKTEVTSVDLSSLYDVYSNIEGSLRPSYAEINNQDVHYRKMQESIIMLLCLYVGFSITFSVINRVRR